MTEEIDPEVLADLQLRAASVHDSSRTRGAGVYDWRPDADVDSWPCRRPGCAIPIGVVQETVDALKVCNDELRKRGEREIPTNAVLICTSCRSIFAGAVAARNQQKREEIADLVRRMKESHAPRQEHAMIKKLTELHHPDVPGLLDALAAKLEAGKNKTAKAKGSKL